MSGATKSLYIRSGGNSSFVFLILLALSMYAQIAATVTGSIIDSMPSDYLAVSTLLKSNPRDAFQSDRRFVHKTKEFYNKLHDPSHLDHHRSHPFIIRYHDEGCDIEADSDGKKASTHMKTDINLVKNEAKAVDACHRLMKTHFGEHSLMYLQQEHAVVTAPLPSLQSFMSSHPDVVAFHTAMIPDMKIHSEVREMSVKPRRTSTSKSTRISKLTSTSSRSSGVNDGNENMATDSSSTSCLEEYVFPNGEYKSQKANPHILRRPSVISLKILLHSALSAEEKEDFFTYAKRLSNADVDVIANDVHFDGGATDNEGVDVGDNKNTKKRPQQQHMINKFELHIPDRQKPGRLHVIQVMLNACDDALPVAQQFAQRREVLWIERAHPSFTHNRFSKGIVDTGGTTNPLVDNTKTNFTGQGDLIGVADTGIDMYNCYFQDPDVDTPLIFASQVTGPDSLNMQHRKVALYIQHVKGNQITDEFDDFTGHGTHVAGIVAGRPLIRYGDYELFEGVSSDARIVFFDIGDKESSAEGGGGLIIPSDINTGLFEVMYSTGVRIMTNSWGTANNNYDLDAVNADTFLWDNPDATVLFSAGNTGETGVNTVVSPSVAKNVVAVGAILNGYDQWRALQFVTDSRYGIDAVAGFSSQGPTTDNRMKPDVLAPGFYITSALGVYNSTEPFCDRHTIFGTSMACPTAAGFALKIRRYLLDGFYPNGERNASDGFTPSGALIKALLVHSSQPMSYRVGTYDFSISDISDTYPSNYQGYGRILMSSLLNFGVSSLDPLTFFLVGGATSSDAHYAAITRTGTANGDTYTFTTSSTSSQGRVRVTMHYTDYPGNPLTTQSNGEARQNLLLVEVSDASGNTWTPYLTAGTVVDNTQVIDIASSDANLKASTTYTVTVYGSSLVQSPQPYALVISQEGATTYVTSPDSVDESAPLDSFTTTGSLIYVLPLAFLTLVLICLVIYFRRVFKAHQDIEVDPDDMDEDAAYQEELGEKSYRGGMFAKIRNIRSNMAKKSRSRGGGADDDGFEADFAD